MHLHLILSGKSTEEKSLLKPPSLQSRYGIIQGVGHEPLLHTLILAMVEIFVALGKAHLLTSNTALSNQHNGKTVLWQLRDKLTNPTTTSFSCPFSSFS